MRDRRALVAGDIADTAFEQSLGDGKDAFAAKFLAGAQLRSSTSRAKERSAMLASWDTRPGIKATD